MTNKTGSISEMKNLNGKELSDMLSSLSRDARANMLISRFASTIAKAKPQMEVVDHLHHTEQKQHKKQKTNAQSSQELIKKRKRGEEVLLLQGQTSEVRRPPAADHKKQKIAAAGKVEEPRQSSCKRKTSLPQPPHDHRRTSNPEEKKKKTTSLSSTRELQKEEMNLKKIIARKAQIDSAIFEDNLKVMREFQRLGNDPYGSNFEFMKKFL